MSEKDPDWLLQVEKLTSKEEVAAYGRFVTRMMDADAAAVKAFGEPLHISKEQWDKQAAEGWKTTDFKPDEDG